MSRRQDRRLAKPFPLTFHAVEAALALLNQQSRSSLATTAISPAVILPAGPVRSMSPSARQ